MIILPLQYRQCNIVVNFIIKNLLMFSMLFAWFGFVTHAKGATTKFDFL